MSKLACECGAILSDVGQEDSDKYWGVIYPCGEENSAREKASQQIQSLVNAFVSGEVSKWLEEYFGKDYPSDMELAGCVSDILQVCYQEKGLAYGRCHQCRSVLIQSERDSSLYNNYAPSSKSSVGI